MISKRNDEAINNISGNLKRKIVYAIIIATLGL